MEYSKRGRIHHKIASVLKKLDGPVLVSDFHVIFHGTKIEPVLYRISTYIWNIKGDGGIVRVVKNGRNIISYELINRNEFDDDGRYVGKQN
jgi:hypothetical protein